MIELHTTLGLGTDCHVEPELDMREALGNACKENSLSTCKRTVFEASCQEQPELSRKQ